MDRANGEPSDVAAGSRGNKGIASSQSEPSCEGGPCGGENGPSPSTSSSTSTKMRANIAAQHDAKLAKPLEVGSGGTTGLLLNLLAAAIVQSTPLQRVTSPTAPASIAASTRHSPAPGSAPQLLIKLRLEEVDVPG